MFTIQNKDNQYFKNTNTGNWVDSLEKASMWKKYSTVEKYYKKIKKMGEQPFIIEITSQYYNKGRDILLIHRVVTPSPYLTHP